MPAPKRKPVPALASEPSDPFIVATDQATIKPDTSSRRLIRRHVMRGKNKKVAAHQRAEFPSWISPYAPTISWSGTLPSQMSLTAPIVGVEPGAMQDILKFNDILTRALQPRELCVDMHWDDWQWLDDFSQDPEYAHTVLYVSRTYFSCIQNQSFGPKILTHINRATHQLQTLLCEGSPVITDGTMLTVLGLALVSLNFGDLEAAKKHVSGMRDLIRFRGGIQTLSQKHSLQIKCCRIDLEVAVTTRAKPLLLTETEISWKPYISRPDKTLAKTPIHTVCSDPDARLINIWLDLREFAKGANLALQTNRKLSPRLFQETLISILYRLLFLSYAEADAQEAFRMLMIHVSTSILFSTQSNNASYSQHEHMLIPALRMMNSFQDTSPKLWLWTAFIARLRQQPPKDYRWLNESMFRRICGVGIAKWDEVRAILKEFIWVDGLYHEAGMRVFDEVMNSRPVSLATGSPSALVPPSA